MTSDSDQSTECFGSEGGTALHCEQDEVLTVLNSPVPQQKLETYPHLPDYLLRTLQLEHVDSLIQTKAENHCDTSKYTTQSLPSISNFTSYPVSHVGATEESYLEATNSAVSDASCSKSWPGQGAGSLGHTGVLSRPDNMFLPVVEVSDVLNESFPNINYEPVLSLDPIDTFMSSFVTSTAPDVSDTINYDNAM